MTSKLLREPFWIALLMCFLIFKCFFFLIYLLVFSYVFSSGNWKWTAKDLYLASLMKACENTEIRLRFSGCIDQKLIQFLSSTGTFDLIFIITLCDFLEFWIVKAVCRNFVLILTLSFYESILLKFWVHLFIRFYYHDNNKSVVKSTLLDRL